MVLPTRAEALKQLVAGVVGVGAPSRTSLDQGADPAASALAANPAFSSYINVRTAHGARGDGVTDDTRAIQNALNAAANTQPRTIYLPRGTYRLTEELVVPFAPGLHIIGDGAEGPTSRLSQSRAGHSILRFSRSLTHTVYMADLELSYSTPQTDPGSMAVVYRDETNKSPSWFHHVYERVKVINAYRGFSLDDTPGTSATVWHTTWRDVNFFQIKNSAIRLVMGKANGQPVLWFQNIGVFNTNGPRVQSNGAAIDLGAAEVLVDQYDIEGWSSPVFSMTAGTFATLRGIHVEQHIFRDRFSYLFNIDNTTFTMDGFSIEGANTAANTDELILLRVQTGAAGRVMNGLITVHAQRGKPYLREFLWRSHEGTDRPVMLENVIRDGGDVNLPGTGPRARDTLKGTMILGELPSGHRGLNMPANSSIYMQSPDGHHWALSMGNGGRLRVRRV